jgi:tRNA (uracil-5-)-methyltransferase
MPAVAPDPAGYAAQLAAKIARYRTDFAPFDLPEPEVFASPPTGYRLRAEFRLWHTRDAAGRTVGIDHAMFDAADPKQPVAVTTFPIAGPRIAEAMPKLREVLLANEVLHRRVFQVEYLSTLSGELLVCLAYHRKLDAEWESAARDLAAMLGAQVVGRSRGQKVAVDRDWLVESFELDGRMLRYRQVEGSFTQPNGAVNRQMLGWARTRAAGLGGDLLELYCGNGNFTIALAPLFGRVLATEMSKTSVHAAEWNLEANGVTNVVMVRMASDEISDALAGVRPFRRLRDIDLGAYAFSTLFVDPPRGGLDPATIALARAFPNILYISCNPDTLRSNVEALSDTHRIANAAAFDQFPWTHHLECGLLLQRR